MNSVECVSKSLKSFNPHPQTSASFLISSGFCLRTNWPETTVPLLRRAKRHGVQSSSGHNHPVWGPTLPAELSNSKGEVNKAGGMMSVKEQQKCRKISEDHD